MKRLILVGGGHAHLKVLQALAREKPTGTEIVLISPNSYQNYSGMLPGWMAGHYNKYSVKSIYGPWHKQHMYEW